MGIAVVALLMLAGCQTGGPATVPAAATIGAVQPAATEAATMEAAATEAAPLLPMPDQWEDHSMFRTGLIKSEQAALEQLSGASIYHLDVTIDDDMAGISGRERVYYTNQETETLEAVYFQLFPNHAGGKSTVSGVMVDEQAVESVYEAENSTVRVPLAAPLQPGEHVVIQLDFQVEIPTQVGGSYGLFGYLNDVLVLDGFYPAIPVYDAQGWHAGIVPPNADTTFQDASFYLVRVTAPATLTVVAAGREVERLDRGDYQTVTFAVGPSRDFYMAASARFERLSKTIGETTVNSYAFKESAEGSQLALDVMATALTEYGKRFGDYPYTEFDLVSTPMQGATGIEYPGIVGINLIMYDLSGNINGTPNSVMMETTVSHEAGHQWFYNVVGNDQINEPWVDESLTQYVTGLYYLDRYGAEAMAEYRGSWLARWKRVGRELIPIGMPAEDYQGLEYGAIVYGRGPLFIEALAQKLKEPQFDAFLRDYYQTHKWGIGTAADFRRLAEQHCECDLSALFKEWVGTH
jgi:hypothetical protein